MSANRSWDVRPSAKPAKRAPADASRVRSAPAARPLGERRRARRRRFGVLIFVLCIAFAGGTLWCLSQPWLRVAAVHATGPYADTTPSVAAAAMGGSWYHLVPRDSLVFPAEESVRQAILAAHPDVMAVSIRRDSLHTLSVETVARISAFLWCGAEKPLDADSRCYAADSEGLIYAYVPTVPDEIEAASTTPGVEFPDIARGLAVYGALVEAPTDDPVGAHVAGAARIPDALRFARALQAIGAPVASIQLRGDEADLYVVPGNTRLTYVIGREDAAYALAKASFPQLDLTGGSIDYVDLRFGGKVYYKKSAGDSAE
jgi:hypothetical protein